MTMFLTMILATDREGNDLVDQVEDALQAAAGEGKSPLAYRRSENSGEGVRQHLWQGMYPGDTLKIVEDEVMGCMYAVIASEDAANAREVYDTLERAIGTLDCEQVRGVIAADVVAEHLRMPMLSLCNSKKHDEKTEKLLLDWIDHDDAEVRLAAAQVMGMLRWPKLRKSLETVRAGEKDERVRRVIDFALAQE
jgi:hypothetical protein